MKIKVGDKVRDKYRLPRPGEPDDINIGVIKRIVYESPNDTMADDHTGKIAGVAVMMPNSLTPTLHPIETFQEIFEKPNQE